METSNPNSTSRADRKTIEKNRRNQMKALYSNLDSLVPRQPFSSSSTSREAVSLSDRLHEATKYIKKLQINLEKLKERKDRLVPQVVGTNYQTSNNVVDHDNTSLMGGGGGGGSGDGGGLRSVVPQLEIHEINGGGCNILDVVLITGLDTKFLLNQTIQVIHQEGADIINASYSLVHDALFHTIRSKVGDSSIAARISERLNRLVQDTRVKLQCSITKIQERIVTTV